jgi:hypothetical protein
MRCLCLYRPFAGVTGQEPSMICITERQLPLDHPAETLRAAIVKRLKIKNLDLFGFTVFKRSYDARKKQ